VLLTATAAAAALSAAPLLGGCGDGNGVRVRIISANMTCQDGQIFLPCDGSVVVDLLRGNDPNLTPMRQVCIEFGGSPAFVSDLGDILRRNRVSFGDLKTGDNVALRIRVYDRTRGKCASPNMAAAPIMEGVSQAAAIVTGSDVRVPLNCSKEGDCPGVASRVIGFVQDIDTFAFAGNAQVERLEAGVTSPGVDGLTVQLPLRAASEIAPSTTWSGALAPQLVNLADSQCVSTIAQLRDGSRTASCEWYPDAPGYQVSAYEVPPLLRQRLQALGLNIADGIVLGRAVNLFVPHGSQPPVFQPTAGAIITGNGVNIRYLDETMTRFTDGQTGTASHGYFVVDAGSRCCATLTAQTGFIGVAPPRMPNTFSTVLEVVSDVGRPPF
jgi:hypothetical protein